MTENAVLNILSDGEALIQQKRRIATDALTTAYAVADADMGVLGEQLLGILPNTKVLELLQVLVVGYDVSFLLYDKAGLGELAKEWARIDNMIPLKDAVAREYFQHVRDIVASAYDAVGEDTQVMAYAMYKELGVADFAELLVNMQTILANAPKGDPDDA
jgi:hypothetical protein